MFFVLGLKKKNLDLKKINHTIEQKLNEFNRTNLITNAQRDTHARKLKLLFEKLLDQLKQKSDHIGIIEHKVFSFCVLFFSFAVFYVPFFASVKKQMSVSFLLLLLFHARRIIFILNSTGCLDAHISTTFDFFKILNS